MTSLPDVKAEKGLRYRQYFILILGKSGYHVSVELHGYRLSTIETKI